MRHVGRVLAWLAALGLALLLRASIATACPNPNPNLQAGDGIHPWVDGCDIPAQSLNRLTSVKLQNLNPVDFGADPLGVADSAAAIRAAVASFTSGARLVFPPGTYNLCSLAASPYPSSTGPPAVLVQSKTNFIIDFGSARFTACNGISGASIAYFTFDKNSNFSVYDGEFFGNMTGKPAASGLSAAVALFNNVNFAFYNQICDGDWQSQGGAGECFGGDFDVNGLILNTNASNVAICFDTAFLLNVTFSRFNCTGKYHGGNGSTGFSEIYDTPNAGINATPYAISDSSGVTISGTASNFNSGWDITSGSGYTIDGFYTANPGTSTLAGWGGIIGYATAGHPVSDVIVRGHYDQNGNPLALGGGIFIQNGAGADFTSGISIDVACYNNISTCLQATFGTGGASNISDVRVKVDCRGANQNACVDPTLNTVINPACVGSGIVMSNGTPINMCALQLPPGVWEINGGVGLIPTGTITFQAAAISQNSNTLPSGAGVVGYNAVGSTTTLDVILPTGNVMVSPGVPTTYYLVAQCNYGAGSGCTGGGTMNAFRQ